MHKYEIAPTEGVEDEIIRKSVRVDALTREAERYLEQPDVDDVSLARMFIDRGLSEDLSYWLVRLAEVRHAPR